MPALCTVDVELTCPGRRGKRPRSWLLRRRFCGREAPRERRWPTSPAEALSVEQLVVDCGMQGE
jgi:hypothetical protein